VAAITGDKPANGLSPDSFTGGGAYLSYAPTEKFPENTPGANGQVFLTEYVAHRSKPVELTPVQNRTGSLSYRVTGTLRRGGKQEKRVFQSLEDAQAQQHLWETQRIQGAASARPKLTSLTNAELKVCEAAMALSKEAGVSLLDGVRAIADFGPIKLKEALKALQLAETEPFSLPDAVKFSISHQLQTTELTSVGYDDGLAIFLKGKKDHISEAHFKRVGQRGRSFSEFIGAKNIRDITAREALAWVESRAKPDGVLTSKSTWNHLVTDLATIFGYFVKQKWCAVNPFGDIDRYSKKSIGAKQRLRLEVSNCEALLRHVEKHHPKWACYFVLTLVLGIRPDLRTGEIFELARCVKRDGVAHYYSNGYLHLSPEITKEREQREVRVSSNAAAWLEKFPLTPANICPGDYKDKDFCSIRKKFQIPHDGLRHTAISAFMAMPGNNYSEAADQFGNSEPIIKKNYLRRMAPEDGVAFYAIMPTKVTPRILSETGVVILG
jgi:hypothetical protein